MRLPFAVSARRVTLTRSGSGRAKLASRRALAPVAAPVISADALSVPLARSRLCKSRQLEMKRSGRPPKAGIALSLAGEGDALTGKIEAGEVQRPILGAIEMTIQRHLGSEKRIGDRKSDRQI